MQGLNGSALARYRVFLGEEASRRTRCTRVTMVNGATLKHWCVIVFGRKKRERAGCAKVDTPSTPATNCFFVYLEGGGAEPNLL